LGTPRNFEASGDIELLTGVVELTDLLVGGKNAALTVDDRNVVLIVPARPRCVVTPATALRILNVSGRPTTSRS
jgi:hypothetical protein